MLFKQGGAVSLFLRLLLAIVAILPLGAKAELLTYSYWGHLGSFFQFEDGRRVPWDGTFPGEKGDTYFGSFSYETNTPASDVSSEGAIYAGALVSLSFYVPKAGFGYSLSSAGDVYVDSTVYYSGIGMHTPFEQGSHAMVISFDEWDGFRERGLDLTPLDLGIVPRLSYVKSAGFSDRLFYIEGVMEGVVRVFPPISTPVPESEVYAMMLGGLGLLAHMVRRRAKAA